ncbi:MAG: FtsX-like permease family protein, partial [Ruminococcus sp.]|nr:FtsX-like permease family protein [Ruminococcus sp.]
RTKEIGILRAIGASKHNISTVFNAETFIIGALAGVIGIVISELIILIANPILHSLTGQDNINAILPPAAALILIVLSVILTLIGGIIPSRKAAKSDPVTALRSE